MNLIEESNNEAAYELMSTYKEQANAIAKSVCHQEDDVLEIGFKVSKIPVSSNFKGIIRDKYTFGKSIVSYVRRDFKKWLSKSDYNTLNNSEKEMYTPVYKIYCPLNENAWAEYSTNNLTIRIDKLAYIDGSRFKLILDEVINSGFILPRHRSEEIHRKLTYNAHRNVILRHAYIKRYEWAYVLDTKVSGVLHRCLMRLAKEKNHVNQCQNTFYLKTGRDSNFSLKIYNIDCAINTPRQDNPQFLAGDRLKIEVTYYRDYFVRNRINIKKLTSPNKISRLLHDSNLKNVSMIFDKLQPAEMRGMMTASCTHSRKEFMSKIFDSETRLEADHKMNELMRKIDKLESTLNRQDREIAEIKDFIGFHAKKDARKLRVVK